MQIQNPDPSNPFTWPVLTLWNPWSELLAHGYKEIETRPKPTSYRGTMLIHSAVATPKWAMRQALDDPYIREALFDLKGKNLWQFDGGYIIGAVDIINCLPILGINQADGRGVLVDKNIDASADAEWIIDKRETAFGNYEAGRSAWICENFRVLVNPIKYKGSQGYYTRFKGDPAELVFKPAKP